MSPDPIIASESESGLRLDKFLSQRFPDFSRTYFQYLIESHLVLINGEVCKKRDKINVGDEIEVEFALTPEISLEAEDIPLDILYEDDSIIAINKPAGLVVHPGAGNPSGTFVNALLFHCKQLPQDNSLRPGIVHRLDKDTTGVLLAAKTEKAQANLVEQFAARKMQKEYLAICIGNPGKRTITGNIGRHPKKRKEMAIVEERGKEAITECEALEYDQTLSYVKLTPKTGRTHQLRVHLQSINTPILGDPLYGSIGQNNKYHIHRQLLHASLLKFLHPITHKSLEIRAPIPQDFQTFINKITHTS